MVGGWGVQLPGPQIKPLGGGLLGAPKNHSKQAVASCGKLWQAVWAVASCVGCADCVQIQHKDTCLIDTDKEKQCLFFSFYLIQ